MRVLLAVGCNTYDHTGALSGAEVDATRIFAALTRPDLGEYDPARSRLLLSPNFEELRQAIAATLFAGEPLDVFTFYFAGHGSVGSGSFYMWIKDTAHTRLSVSGLSLSELFKNLSEAAPRQSNIIIDACESGGLVEDLGALLKPSFMGDAGSPAVTLVATSAQDEGAGETDEGGFGTTVILDCIEGREFVQDTSPALELIDIGRKVAARVASEAAGSQNPVVWGLNLYGPPAFCKNPRFGHDPGLSLREVMGAWSPEADQRVRRHVGQLWKTYADVAGSWSHSDFSALMRALLRSAPGEEAVVGQLAERLCATFLQAATACEDQFRRVEVAATIAVALLPVAQTPSAAGSAERLIAIVHLELSRACGHLLAALEQDRYALLPHRGNSLAELYDLPVRVAKVMAWAAMLPALAPTGDKDAATQRFTALLRAILEHYAGSTVAVSDAQAPCWAVVLCQLAALGLTEEAEQVAGLVFHSLVIHGGHVARTDLPPAQVMNFLLARASNDYSASYDLLERPAESLTVLLRAAAMLGLGDVFDPSLWKLDDTHLLAFITDQYSGFAEPLIERGSNLMWTIGHDIFRTQDLITSWPPGGTPIPPGPVTHLCTLASLLYPDRIPWFLFDARSVVLAAEG